MNILGLDISSSKIGIAVLDTADNILVSETIRLKSSMPLEERALKFETRMREIEKHYTPMCVFVEQPALMFKGGKTTAQTMAKLQRFNGMCCYIVYSVFDMVPTLINPRSARSKLGIKVPKGSDSKKVIIEWVKSKYKEQFIFELTHHGNPRPGTDDRADAIITALAGTELDNS